MNDRLHFDHIYDPHQVLLAMRQNECYFRAETMEVIREWKEIKKGLEHKPFRPESEAYRVFLSQIVLKINRIKEKLPYFDVQKEMEQCEIRLKI